MLEIDITDCNDSSQTNTEYEQIEKIMENEIDISDVNTGKRKSAVGSKRFKIDMAN